MKAVIFDVDGTLVDSVDLHAKAWQKAFADFGHEFSFDEVRSQIGKGGDQLLPVFLSESEIEERGHALEKHRSQLFKRDYLKQIKAFPQVRDLFLRLLDDGWRIALASSAKGDELDIYKNLCNVADLLEAETSSDDAEKSKPHPDIFQAAVARLKLTPDECIVVGDTPYDADAAGRADILSIGVLCGGFPAEDLTAAGCHALYEGAADLLARYDDSLFHERRPTATAAR